MNNLPKSKLFWLRWWKGNRRLAKFRNANAMFVWIGPLEIGWRMPWLKDVAEQIYRRKP